MLPALTLDVELVDEPELAEGGGDSKNKVAVGEPSIVVGLDCGCCWTDKIS